MAPECQDKRSGRGLALRGPLARLQVAMLKVFIVYFRYKNPNDKEPGPVRQFRLYANSLDEARRLAASYANYPNVQVLNVRPG